ncbi:phage major capsid protein [Bacillus mycoides]|uniref:phage major capsid protein n=1 Tax=Bacillus mycoides TaxID=1405 RepID=UPI0002799301|nr:phage major capsid protein [Bacillus mycoides]EJS15361.1 HK97 family phage major capsid protein [Bacillus cereus VDM062]QWI23223.1 phage major capsid protein [Bacillus mycoides]WJE75190.1 phage major capsid protein [Bacillus mycoides]
MKLKEILKASQARNKARLEELQGKVEKGEFRSEELAEVKAEVELLTQEAQTLADELVKLEEAEKEEDPEKKNEVKEEKKEDPAVKENPNATTEISEEQRSVIMTSIATGLSTKGHKSTKIKEEEIRSAFANFVVGRISEVEARSLGIEAGNGSVTIPEVIASEIITYAQEENLLRKYGTRHKTNGNVKYPVLVKKANANVNKHERGSGNEIPETDIEFDEILLDPAEFDALATVTKKLMKMSGINVENIVIEELKKAYVRKETNYMFNGNDAGNENPGALAKKSVKYYESEVIDTNVAGYSQKLYQQLVKLKGQPVTEVLKKSMWLINRAALTVLEGMTDTTGRPMLYQAPDGVGYKLLGHNVDFTDAANGTDPTKPVFYFGDFKAFHIQDVIGAMELEKKVELYSKQNKIGFQIYNLLDGQLVYSPFEPAVYRYEVGLKKV